jgi:hypothetical protein
MKAEFKAMQEALMRLFESFIEENASAFPQWELSCRMENPGNPALPGWLRDAYMVHFVLQCRRPCCRHAADEIAHIVRCLVGIFEPQPEGVGRPTGLAVFKAFLNGLGDFDENLVLPDFKLDDPTLDSVLEAGKQLLAHVPELHRILEADTLDWRTRFEMRGY